MSQQIRPSSRGALYGIAAACLFGAGIPLSKQLLISIQPFLLAGLFYLGSALGLTALFLLSRRRDRQTSSQASLSQSDWSWLWAAIFAGGVLGALLEMYGLKRTSASDASLLLNLEGAFTALVAWIVFRENAGLRTVLGMTLLTAGAIALCLGADLHVHFSIGNLCIIAGCLCWGIDNNLTRKIAHSNPLFSAAVKGWAAGILNLSIALLTGASLPSAVLLLSACGLGFLSYGMSLVCFILSMRHVGAARTGAYFCAAPFVGATLSIIFLNEPITAPFIAATALMGLGIWLHLTETHSHAHTHKAIAHEHVHTHDEHHKHTHPDGTLDYGPHSHGHTHEEITHHHPHFPDTHHRHEH